MNKKEALKVFGMERWEKMNSTDLRIIYKSLAKKLHPDVPGGDKDKFVELQNAFEFLLRKVDDKLPNRINKEDYDKPEEKISDKESAKTDSEEAKWESDEDYTDPDNIDVRDIKALDKNEILDKYYEAEKQLVVYNESVERQKNEIITTKDRVREIIGEFHVRKDELKNELQKRVEGLEKEYKGSFLKKLFFFWPKMSESEFWRLYNEELQAYSKAHLQMDLEFFRKVADVYGDGLNNIQETLKDL